MFEYILVLAAAFLCYISYTWVLKTKRLKTRYAKLFRQQGYRVIDFPLVPYAAPYYRDIR
jgi:cytochrome P450